MKYLGCFLLLLYNTCFAQTPINYLGFASMRHRQDRVVLQGSWSVDHLITSKDIRTYTLHRLDSSLQFHYGNTVTFSPNGTFSSSYSAKCGNDVFTTSNGRYKVVDDNYVCLWLEKVSQSGDWRLYDKETNKLVTNSTQKLDLDFGLYRIVVKADQLMLVQSDGNPVNDQKKEEYRSQLWDKRKEIMSCKYLKWMKIKKSFNPKTIVEVVMQANEIEDYEFLYHDHIDGINLILVKVNQVYRYLIFDGYDRNTLKVAMYDPDFLAKNKKQILQIDYNKSLDTIRLFDDFDNKRNPLSTNTFLLYKDKDQIVKIVYESELRDLRTFTQTYYLNSMEPFAYQITFNKMTDSYAVFDWSNNYGAIITNPSTNNFSFAGAREHFDGFIKVAKRQLGE